MGQKKLKDIYGISIGYANFNLKGYTFFHTPCIGLYC